MSHNETAEPPNNRKPNRPPLWSEQPPRGPQAGRPPQEDHTLHLPELGPTNIEGGYATVALSLPFKFHTGGTDGLTYSIPPELAVAAQIGTRVLVPLGKRERTGVLVHWTDTPPAITSRLRPIIDVLDSGPVFDEAFLRWTKWIAEYYLTSWGEVLAAALPEGLKPESKGRVIPDLVKAGLALPEMERRAPLRARILREVLGHPAGLSIDRLQKQLGSKHLHAALHLLARQELLQIDRPLSRQSKIPTETIVTLAPSLGIGSDALSLVLSELERHAPRQANILLAIVLQIQMDPDHPLTPQLLLKKAGAARATLDALRKKEYIVLTKRERQQAEFRGFAEPTEEDITNIRLTIEQQVAVESISTQMDTGVPKTFLLHGVTGSGKTEVYISLARRALESGRGVLILVPEIALTPQLIERFQRRLSLGLDQPIAVLHSRMSIHERYAAWRGLARGRTKLAIGARSAVFAPVQDLQLIIIDEEHEATYKQYDKTPRYHARDMAIVRAAMLNGVAVLGSATPSVESYYNALEGKYELLRLTQRAKQAQLPSVRVIDLRTTDNRRDFSKTHSSLTPELREAIQQRLDRHEGIVLFQNRRGFSTYQECLNCGAAEMCKNCSVTMTFHRAKGQMRCHYCGAYSAPRTTCSTCGSDSLRLGGTGTQKVEEDVQKAFPDARLLRMDLDTTAKKGAYQTILTTFAAGEADILLGTQMVAKGLDFPRVTLVGVISADTSLCIPDFRASERTFQLLTQVAGRAGRSHLAGEVLIQTLQPTHPAVLLSVAHNYEAFFQQEINDRAPLHYPPFSRLVLIEFRGLHEEPVHQRAEQFASLFPERASFYERVGPAQPAIGKLRGEYRWHLLIKDFKKADPNGGKMRRLLTGALEAYQKRFASPHVTLTVDVDVQGIS